MADDRDLILEPRDAARMADAGEAILVDVVSSSAWASLREVPAKSLRIPPAEFRDRAAELPFERALITYCT